MSYNFVIYNYPEGGVLSRKRGYYSMCLDDLRNLSNVQIIDSFLAKASLFTRWIYRIHNSGYLNRICDIPFKSFWYKHVVDIRFDNNDPICFVFLWFPPIEYLYYLKKTYSKCILVRACRDLFDSSKTYKRYYEAGIFDYWMSFDKGDCEKYGMTYFSEFESYVDVKTKSESCDVFFAGRAKNRLGKLINYYDQLSNLGLNCFFYIVGVPKSKRIERQGIKYSDKPMAYVNMLEFSSSSRCILEVNQEGADGFTSRFLEAVILGRRLITDNLTIKESRFYKSGYIYCISEDLKDIPSAFFKGDFAVDYKYNGEFSPIIFLQKVQQVIKNNE